MKVQHSDEMSISTYSPRLGGNATLGLSAKMVPVAGGRYEIRPDGECAIDVAVCLQHLTSMMNRFKRDVSAAMK
jgi:hypothetical protein